jgi:methylenetetrahydrofolate dehydrogenase (NADP+)/methenyltetrahydrofolate cyclohydrolase
VNFMVKIDCKKYADDIIEAVRLRNIGNENPKKLVIFTAGDDPASEAYLKGKLMDCAKCGIPVKQVRAKSQWELLLKIENANWCDDIGGIIVQLPLPEGFEEREVVNAIRKSKDVDGFKQGSPFLPCTPEGILWVLKQELGDLSGKTVLLIGKGKLVGKPLIDILLDH